MKLDTIHHIAIIGHDYAKTKTFYVDKLGFEMLDEHHRPDKEDILFNVRKGNLTLEIFIKEKAPKRPFLPHPEHTGLRHLAFRVTDVEATLAEFDRLEIPHTELRYDDFDGRKMAFFLIPMACLWSFMNKKSLGSFHCKINILMTIARYMKNVKRKPARQKNLKNLG